LPRGGWCSFSPDGKKLAYNRVFREFRTWKRYLGGQADDLWLYDFATHQTSRITQDPAQDLYPMWTGDKLYFVSERGENHQANLWVHEFSTGKERQLTHFIEYAVKFPSLGDAAIVFENGGFIYRFDLATEKAVQVPVEIREDLASGRTEMVDASKHITGWDLAPDGARAVFTARGDIFTGPARNGATRNLTQTSGVHERDAVWSPNGRWIAYISDVSGEDELWMRPQDGSGTPVQLTSEADTYKYAPVWSPDSRKLAWSDKKNRLNVVETDSRKTSVADTGAWEITDFAWSPDSQWIAYVRPENRKFSQLHLLNLADGRRAEASDGWFEVGSPEFSSDGKLLFFVSARSFSPTYGSLEFNHVYNEMQKIYFVTLAQDIPSPLAPKSDEVKYQDSKTNTPPDAKAREAAIPAGESVARVGGEAAIDSGKSAAGAVAEAKKDKKDTAAKVEVRVDADGLSQRVGVLPVSAGAYAQLTSVGDKLFYVSKGKLFVFDFEKQKDTEVAEAAGYVISSDHKKMLIKAGENFSLIDLPSVARPPLSGPRAPPQPRQGALAKSALLPPPEAPSISVHWAPLSS
jgi:tricorn protease